MQHRHHIAFSVVGWYGMSAVLVAYALVSLAVLPSHSIIYILLNLTGAVGLVIAAAIKRADQLVVLNIVWAIVALVSLAQVLLR